MNKPKSLSNKVLLAAFFLLAAATAWARQWPHESSDLPADPAIQWGRMDNGIRYVILPWSEPPGRLSLRLLFEAGSIHETERQKGLAHMLEHMAFNGTRHFSAGEMVEYFQRLGMAFGPDTNAHTWWRETVYKLELPRNDEALLRDAFKLFRDYADGMLLEEPEIEKEKGVVLSEFRDAKSPQFLAYLDGIKFALPDSLLSDRVTIGDEDVLHMATRADLLDYYRKWYTPDRMVLVAVGDADPTQIEALMREYFADMPPNDDPLPDPDLGTIVPADTRTRLFSNAELPIGELEIFTRRQISPQPDTLADRRERMKIELANAMLSRRFEKLSKEEGAPFTRGMGYDYRWLDFVRYSGVFLNFEPVDWRRAMELATTELNRAVAYGFTEAELEEARANLVNGYEEAAARAPTRKSKDLSEGIVRAVRDGEVFTDPVAARDILVPVAAAIELDEVNAAFSEAWSQPERMVNVTGNFESILQKEFEQAMAVEVQPQQQEERAPWAYESFGSPGSVVESNYIEDLDLRQLVLSNGVRLNLKQTDFEANKILVKASFGDGRLAAPADQPGLPLLAQSIFIDGGLGRHSHDEIQALTAGRTVAADFSVDDNQFTLGGLTNRDDLRLQLQIIAAYLSDPGFRPEGERLFKRELDALYTQLAHDPRAVMQNEVARFLAGGDPRFGFPEREQLEARSTAEVAAWLEDALRNGYLELSIVGDFADSDELVTAVLETLGALPARRPARSASEEARQVAFPRGASARVFTYLSDIPRAFATVNWPTVDQRDIAEVRRLSVLSSVYSDRMRIRIREEIGEAYSPYAVNNSSDTYRGYGVFRALVGVQPDKADLIQGILLDIGADLAGNGIDADELVRAIEPIKSGIKEYRRSNAYWMNSVLLRSQGEPERLDWARSLADFWDTVTVDQVNELARRFLQPEDALPVQVQPRS